MIKEFVSVFNLGEADRGQRNPTDVTDAYLCTIRETCGSRFCKTPDAVHKSVQIFSLLSENKLVTPINQSLGVIV